MPDKHQIKSRWFDQLAAASIPIINALYEHRRCRCTQVAWKPLIFTVVNLAETLIRYNM